MSWLVINGREREGKRDENLPFPSGNHHIYVAMFQGKLRFGLNLGFLCVPGTHITNYLQEGKTFHIFI